MSISQKEYLTYVYFNIVEDYIDIRGCKGIQVRSNETFKSLKLRCLKQYAQFSANLDCRYDIRVHFRSISLLPRKPLLPHDDDLVVRVLSSESKRWPGFIYVLLENTTNRFPLGSSVGNIRKNALDKVDNQIIPVPLVRLSCEWLLPDDNLNGKKVVGALNDIVDAVGTKAGRIQKYQQCKAAWCDVYAVVDESRIWFYGISEADAAFSFLELDKDLTCSIADDTTIVLKSNRSTSRQLQTGREIESSELLINNEPNEIKLRTKSHKELIEWRLAIQNRYQALMKSEDEEILFAEKMIEHDQKSFFENDIDAYNALTTFEGMIKNRYLRQKFREYLAKSYSDEFLKFWEYAEDYRCGHPKSAQPFTFQGDADCAEKIVVNSAYIKRWAMFIFEAFLKDGAKHQVFSFAYSLSLYIALLLYFVSFFIYFYFAL